MIAALLVAGLGAIALGGVVGARRASFAVGLGLQATGAAAVGVAGFWTLGSGTELGAGFASDFTIRVGVDGLSGLFLGTLGLIAAPALVFSLGYLEPTARGRAVGTLTSAFLLALALVLCARDPLTFLAGWELMTLLSGAVILVARGADRHARQTVFSYFAVTHLGGVGTWVAILLLANAGAIGNPGAVASGSGVQAAIALAALAGMGTKAGVMPLHVWLPRAHPLAPAPVSALMSGVMIKVALYGLVRVLVEWDGVLPVWFGVLVLGAGALSAVGGVVYALFQHDLKRLLALHSIENVGIIVLGIGACLVLRARGAGEWAAFALAAALLHSVNHAVFKALLFLGAGAFERAVGSLEVDRLGGLLRRMPWTGAAFFVGAMAIAGLPPLNGFASEWLTLQALLHVPAYAHVADGVAGAVALGALASTAALAVFCFVKVVGLVLLGPPRTHAAAAATESPLPLRVAIGSLAVACVVLGFAPGVLFGALVGLAPWSGAVATEVGLHVPGTGSLPTVGLAVALVAGTAALMLLRGTRSAAPAPSWACGQRVEPALRWTSAGFTKPLRLVLEAVLRPQREIVVRTEGGVVREVSYSGHVPHLIDEHVYAPVTRVSLVAAGFARRLQSGSLGTYVSYLIGLVVVLLAAARLGVIG
ncbi:MAG TPA: proton-conducting transporter membrane subunit [Gaiellaceae bacterium]